MRSGQILILSFVFLMITLSCGRQTPDSTKRDEEPTGPAIATHPPASGLSDTNQKSFHGLEITKAGVQTTKLCRLFVHREWYENGKESRENYRVEVSTDYEHQGQGLGKRILAFTRKPEENRLDWEDEASGQYLRVEFWEAETALKNPKEFSIRWRHNKHFHKNICGSLR